MKKVKIGDKTMEVFIVYSHRKSIELSIMPEGTLKIKSPKGIPFTQLEEILMKKEKWILRHMKDVEEIKSQTQVALEEGAKLLYRGQWYTLKINEQLDGKESLVEVEEDTILLYEPKVANTQVPKLYELRREKLIAWFAEETAKSIQLAIKTYSNQLGVSPQRIRLKDQKSRWGSCSSKGNLNFNWRLSMMPSSTLTYIVVHELSHLLEMNHSKKFYRLVEKVLPTFKEDQRWLKAHGALVMSQLKRS